jgi:hypothetical protein
MIRRAGWRSTEVVVVVVVEVKGVVVYGEWNQANLNAALPYLFQMPLSPPPHHPGFCPGPLEHLPF